MVPKVAAGQSGPTFEFRKAIHLVEARTLRATSLGQLLTAVTLAENLSIFHHLHRHFLVEPDLLPEYPNDFARWVATELGRQVVAERLANVNLFRARTLGDVRREMAVILAEEIYREAEGGHSRPDRAFIFCLPRIVILPCARQAESPGEFLAILWDIEIESIAFHLFAPKLRPSGSRTDFAAWFETWGYRTLAQRLDSFDPYVNSLDDNRRYLAEMIQEELEAGEGGGGA